MRIDVLGLALALVLGLAFAPGDVVGQTPKPDPQAPEKGGASDSEASGKPGAEEPASPPEKKPAKRPVFQPSDKIPADVPSAFPTDI